MVATRRFNPRPLCNAEPACAPNYLAAILSPPHTCERANKRASRAKCVSVAALCQLAIIVFGCSEESAKPSRDGSSSLNLRGYECISLKSVDIDPNLGFPGLPAQLTPVLQSQLLSSERWLYRGPAPDTTVVVGTHMESRRARPAGDNGSASSAPADDRRSVAVAVTMLRVEIPSKMEHALGQPRSMTCRVDVFDEKTAAPLGSKVVEGSSGPSIAKRLAAHVVAGPGAVLPPLNEDMDKSSLLSNTAKAIVEALEAAKR